MGWTVARQDGKVVQVKLRSCARVSNECKRRLVVLDERMAWMSDRELFTETALAVRDFVWYLLLWWLKRQAKGIDFLYMHKKRDKEMSEEEANLAGVRQGEMI
jgi:hypothetical protein